MLGQPEAQSHKIFKATMRCKADQKCKIPTSYETVNDFWAIDKKNEKVLDVSIKVSIVSFQ